MQELCNNAGQTDQNQKINKQQGKNMSESFPTQTQNNEQVQPDEQLESMYGEATNAPNEAAAQQVNNPSEAQAMAEASKVARDKFTALQSSETWAEASEERRAELIKEHEELVERAEQYTGALHRMPYEERAALSDLARDAFRGPKIEAIKDRVSGKITANSLSEFEKLVSKNEKMYEDSFKENAEKLASKPQFLQAQELIRQLHGTNISPDEMQHLYNASNDPNTTVTDFTQAVQGVYNQHAIKPTRDDYATMKHVLKSIESGHVPTLDEILDATPNNQGDIARHFRNVQRRQAEGTFY